MPDPKAQVRELCLAWPETSQEPFGLQDEHVKYNVHGKSFAYLMDNHHDDGRLALWCKGQPGLQAMLVAADPIRFFTPPYVGPKGWIGIRLDVEAVDWGQVEDLLLESYRMSAPKKLLKVFDQEFPGG